MRVIVNENFKVFHGHVPVQLTHGQVVTGSLAQLLARSARNRVTVLTDDAGGQDPDATGGTGGEPEPPHPPPAPSASPPNDSDPSTLPPSGELDIGAPVTDVLTWVGDDPERAAEALRQEEASAKPRTTLVKQLAKIAGE